MNVKTSSITVLHLIFGAVFIAPGKVVADPLCTATRLGDSCRFMADSTGHINTVIGGDGSQFAFMKSPVANIYKKIDRGSGHGFYSVYSLQNGSNKIGYEFDQGGSLERAVSSPTFLSPGSASHGWVTPPGRLPATDINTQGQFVGVSLDVIRVDP